MFDLTLFVSGAALFDSFSTTQQIIIVILLFSTEKPIRNSLGFILGVTVAYFVCGLIGLALVDKLNAMLKLFLPNLDAVPDQSYYLGQLVLGAGLTVGGPLYWLFKKKSKRPPVENRLLILLKRMNFWVALGFGAFLSATSFTSAIPYVGAIEKISASHLGPSGQVVFILLYNVVYALPMIVPFGLFVFLREGIVHALHLHVQRLNTVITILLLSGMGLFLAADSLAYFWWAKPLLKSRFL